MLLLWQRELHLRLFLKHLQLRELHGPLQVQCKSPCPPKAVIAYIAARMPTTGEPCQLSSAVANPRTSAVMPVAGVKALRQ